VVASEKDYGSINSVGSQREHGMDKKIAQRGARYHCTTAGSTNTEGGKAYRKFQVIQRD
jgi:hypothetical protein